MTQRNNAVQEEGMFSDEALQAWLGGEIHRFIHVEKIMSRTQLAEAARVSVDTLDAIRKTGEGRRPVRMSAMLSLCCVMGERRVNGLIAHIGYSGATPLDEPDKPDVRNIVANVLPHLARIGEAAKDGVIDYREQPMTTEAADHIIFEILPLSSAGRAE